MNDRSPAEAVFFAALEKTAPEERTAYLEEACAGDDTLRRRVETLLAAQAQVGQFLERPIAQAEGVTAPAMENSAPDLSFLAPPSELGSLGRLDHYEILEVVGSGGMGVVLRARDTKLLRVVAVKVLAAPLAASGSARQRFVREARAAAAVRDEHVVAIHAVENQGPVPYLVMEFIDGQNLETRLRRCGPLEVKDVLRIGLQVAAGLAAAHKQGLIHRDVKPANILLENGVQRVKLTDFGLARAGDDASMTQSGLIAGTPLYMSPEQAAGEPIDTRTDLFSLGSVLYEMCTGRPAFRAPSTVAVIKRVCEESPRPIREVNPDVPEALSRFIDRLHAKKPADRPASAQEVADQLALLLADLQQRGPAALLAVAPAVVAPRRSGPSSPWLWAAAALALLLGGLALSEATNFTNLRGTVLRLFSSDEIAAPRREAIPWERSVAGLTAEQQVEAVARRLQKLNPGFDGKEAHTIEDGVVRELVFSTANVSDISPVRALRGLRLLDCSGDWPQEGKLSDLGPLRGLPLTSLICGTNPIADLSPLKDVPLKELRLGSTHVSDLTPLKGMQLETLHLNRTRTGDLSPLAEMKTLRDLWVYETPVSDLSPLRGLHLTKLLAARTRIADLSALKNMPLEILHAEYRPEDDEVWRSLKGLKEINAKSASEFWKEVESK